MMDDYKLFSRFYVKDAAVNLGNLFEQNGIEYLLEDNSINFDPSFSANELSIIMNS